MQFPSKTKCSRQCSVEDSYWSPPFLQAPIEGRSTHIVANSQLKERTLDRALAANCHLEKKDTQQSSQLMAASCCHDPREPISPTLRTIPGIMFVVQMSFGELQLPLFHSMSSACGSDLATTECIPVDSSELSQKTLPKKRKQGRRSLKPGSQEATRTLNPSIFFSIFPIRYHYP